MGFCGLDRRREPLQGDEVRACWEDGSVAAQPDPITPGLLDLLTATALGEPPVGEGAAPVRPRFAVASSTGSRRLWVEVEAGGRA